MTEATLLELPCVCANVRRAARVLTNVYEEALRSFQLSSSQLTILQVLWRAGELSQGALGQALAMNSTTLTRTLRTMVRAGWIQTGQGTDRREKRLRLSAAGRRLLQRALPAWERAQRKVLRKFGQQRWAALHTLLHQLTTTTH